MKFPGMLVGLILCGIAGHAAPLGTETPIKAYGTPTTVSVSTSAWTKIPASSSVDGRTGLIVSVPASNTANMVAHLGACSGTSIATTVRPMELVKGHGFILVPIEARVCLYVLSLHSAVENIHTQEIKQ